MEWMCDMFDINIESNDSISFSPQTVQNHSNGSLMDINLTHDYHLTDEESLSYELIMSSVVIPAVCAFGLQNFTKSWSTDNINDCQSGDGCQM